MDDFIQIWSVYRTNIEIQKHTFSRTSPLKIRTVNSVMYPKALTSAAILAAPQMLIQ